MMAFIPASRAARTMSKSSASRGNRSGYGWQCRSTAPVMSMSGPPYVRWGIEHPFLRNVTRWSGWRMADAPAARPRLCLPLASWALFAPPARCRVQQGQDALGGHRQPGRAAPGRVGDRAGDGGRGRADRRLADAASVKGTFPLAALDDLHLDVGHVQRGGDEVAGEQARRGVPLLEDDLLGERVAEPLHGAALDLPLDPHRVDG